MAAGLVTRGALRGGRFVRLFPDTYAPAFDEPADLALRSRAAYRCLEGRGVVAGYSAAELLEASCAPRGAPAEVTVAPDGGRRRHPGLLVHRAVLAPGEIWDVDGVQVTTPLRTAYDLARRGDLVEGVVAVDALARRHGWSTPST